METGYTILVLECNVKCHDYQTHGTVVEEGEAKVSRRGPAPERRHASSTLLGRISLVTDSRVTRMIWGGLALAKDLYVHFPDKMAVLEQCWRISSPVSKRSWSKSRVNTSRFPAALHELLANTQRELDEIKPPFVRDMRQKAPHVFKTVERRRSELIGHFFGKLFVEGQRAEWCAKIFRQIMIEILLGTVSGDRKSGESEELGRTQGVRFRGPRRRPEGVRTRRKEIMNAFPVIRDRHWCSPLR